MAISFVQITKGDFTTGSASFARTFSSGTTAGSIILAVGGFDSVATAVTVTDNNGDAVTDSGLGLTTNATGGFRIWAKAFLTPTTGTTTITATYTGTNPTYGDMYIYEIAGLTSVTFDKFVSATGLANGQPPNSGSTGTLTVADEAAVAYAMSAVAMITKGASWTTGQGSTVGTNDGDGFTTNTASIGEHQVTAATTAIAGDATANGGQWAMLCVTLKGSAADTLLGQACL